MKSNQIKSSWFLVREKNRRTQGKKSQSRVDNKRTQPTSEIPEEVKSYVFKLSGL